MTNIATLVIHGGEQTDKAHNAIFPPITTASSFIRKNIGDEGDFSYSRGGNPTRYAYETSLAALEAGTYATATASGMAATALALELLPKDAHIVVMKGIYGGTYRLFESLRKKTSGLEFTYVDMNNSNAILSAIKPNTKMLWIESPSNPLLEIVDIKAVADVVKGKGLIVCVDNTFATGWNQRPLELGADLVMLSTSKYIGGHSDLIGGALICKDEELTKEIDLNKTTVGAVASPFDAYLALRGLKTLDLRMQRQCANALVVATTLSSHPKITDVHYPGLPSHPQHALCLKQMRTGGAVVTIRIDGDIEVVKSFIGKLNYFVLADSLGGLESMINHTATMSHGSMTTQEQADVGVYENTVRLSVGCEDINDLLADLINALG